MKKKKSERYEIAKDLVTFVDRDKEIIFINVGHLLSNHIKINAKDFETIIAIWQSDAEN